MTPGSAVRHASVARHITDCAMRPGTMMVMMMMMIMMMMMNDDLEFHQ